MFERKVALIKSIREPLIRKNMLTKKIGKIKPAINEDNLSSFFRESKFKIKQKQKTAKAARSKIATILNRKAIPSSKPGRKNFFLSIRSNADAMIGKSIKFSALAILPSKNGRPNDMVKTKVVRYGMLLLPLLF